MQRRFAALILLLGLLLVLAGPAAANAQETTQVTAGIGLNLRSAPGTHNPILTVMPYGSTVSTGEVSGDWMQVTFNGIAGWAHVSWLGNVSFQASYTQPTPSQSGSAGGYSYITGGYYSGSVIDAIYYWGAYYGVSGDWLYRVAACESGFDPYAIGPNGEIGVFQFMPSTFYAYGGASIYDPWDQARVASQMFSQGLSWHWVCQ